MLKSTRTGNMIWFCLVWAPPNIRTEPACHPRSAKSPVDVAHLVRFLHRRPGRSLKTERDPRRHHGFKKVAVFFGQFRFKTIHFGMTSLYKKQQGKVVVICHRALDMDWNRSWHSGFHQVNQLIPSHFYEIHPWNILKPSFAIGSPYFRPILGVLFPLDPRDELAKMDVSENLASP